MATRLREYHWTIATWTLQRHWLCKHGGTMILWTWQDNDCTNVNRTNMIGQRQSKVNKRAMTTSTWWSGDYLQTEFTVQQDEVQIIFYVDLRFSSLLRPVEGTSMTQCDERVKKGSGKGQERVRKRSEAAQEKPGQERVRESTRNLLSNSWIKQQHPEDRDCSWIVFPHLWLIETLRARVRLLSAGRYAVSLVIHTAELRFQGLNVAVWNCRCPHQINVTVIAQVRLILLSLPRSTVWHCCCPGQM